MEYKLTLLTLSSLEKVFADEPFEPRYVLSEHTMLQGERYAFQIAYYLDNSVIHCDTKVEVSGALAEYVTVRRVDSVPSLMPAYSWQDDYVLRKTPGLYPDLLSTCENRVRILSRQWGSLWITVSEQCPLPAGEYELNFTFIAEETDEVMSTCTVTVRRLADVLPPQTLIHTEWMHTDCIADWYQVPVFSEAYWTLVERYVRSAVDYGVNMILTPLFTPPLDTVPGGERTTVQLIDVWKTPDGYRFGMDKLERWFKMCEMCGIKYFEMSHLVTQWGAEFAPKIVAYEGVPETSSADAKPVKIFGWENGATSPEYVEFLDAFLPELMKFIREQGLEGRCYFHVSDEPKTPDIPAYLKARDVIKRHLGEHSIMDACSNYDFYEEGVIDIPICKNNNLELYLENKVPNLWTYYCCSQVEDVSNRFFCMPSLRNRILGTQLYKFGMVGFLHWGFNFWNSQLSLRRINPYQVTDGDGAFPSGDAFLVYPGEEGPLGSIRAEVFYEGLQDMRLLQLVESRIGRQAVLDMIEEMCDEPMTFKVYPREEEWLFALRKRCHEKLS